MLASRSPQREAILRQLAIPFRVCPSDFAELPGGGDPRATVEHNAAGKARDVVARTPVGTAEVVLGVDTVVVADGTIYGKANAPAEARVFLRALSGRTHDVWSGLCLLRGERQVTAQARTAVTFRDLDDATVAAYVETGEWRGRAGAYAIQGIGSVLVTGVEGDYWNVVGLPVAALLDALSGFGARPLSWL